MNCGVALELASQTNARVEPTKSDSALEQLLNYEPSSSAEKIIRQNTPQLARLGLFSRFTKDVVSRVFVTAARPV
jgi:hypothetical protein